MFVGINYCGRINYRIGRENKNQVKLIKKRKKFLNMKF